MIVDGLLFHVKSPIACIHHWGECRFYWPHCCHDSPILVNNHLAPSPHSPSLCLLLLQAEYFTIWIILLVQSLLALPIGPFIGLPPYWYHLLWEPLQPLLNAPATPETCL